MKLFAPFVSIVVLCGTQQVAVAQTGTAPYCLQTTAGTRCVFGTMGECERARGSYLIQSVHHTHRRAWDHRPG